METTIGRVSAGSSEGRTEGRRLCTGDGGYDEARAAGT